MLRAGRQACTVQVVEALLPQNVSARAELDHQHACERSSRTRAIEFAARHVSAVRRLLHCVQKILGGGSHRSEFPLPPHTSRTVQLHDQSTSVLIKVSSTSNRYVAAVAGLFDLGYGTACRSCRVYVRPDRVACRVEPVDQSALDSAQCWAAALGSATDRPAAEDVASVRRLLHRDSIRVGAWWSAEAAKLLLPLRLAGRVEFDEPVHAYTA